MTDPDLQRGSCPAESDLPFFAYGIFMPGEIAFFQIKDHVQGVAPASTAGQLLIRDGVPVLDRTADDESTDGFKIEFKPGHGRTAYSAIQSMEPSSQYKWQPADGMNVLAGFKPKNGSRPLYGEAWSSWRDPAFVDALSVVEEGLAQQSSGTTSSPFSAFKARTCCFGRPSNVTSRYATGWATTAP